MPQATRLESKNKLSVAARLARIRLIVEALPDGDQDKADLILLFEEYDKAIEEKHKLQGALDIAQTFLEAALEKIGKQRSALEVLMTKAAK